jgi:cephalosporin hydroxylase
MTDAASWQRRQGVWGKLNGLHPQPLDLTRVALIRDANLDALTQQSALEALLLELGLNDEAIEELPEAVRAHAGAGLRIWQYPNQFAPYLIQLARLRVRSYVEVGIRHGGSFVATAEYLERFHPLSFAVGIDIIPCPAMREYEQLNPKAKFWCANTLATDFAMRLDEMGPIDLVFIDSHHEEDQCRRELAVLAERAAMLAFHDIDNVICPGVGRVWRELRDSGRYECFEYAEQYGSLGPFMGIGLAIKKARLQ